MKGNLRKSSLESGITLIALVITIIVLLILAGVTLSTLFGNNGILTESQRAVAENKEANAKEQVQLAWTACETEYQTAWTKDSSIEKDDYFEKEDLNRNLGVGEVTDVTFNNTGKSKVTYTLDGTTYEFEMLNGQVYKVDEGPTVTEPAKSELTGIMLSEETINLKVGETKTLTATKVPAHANDTLVFTSEQPTIATVDPTSGEIEGVMAGQATITVKGTKKPEIAKQCTVIVENPPVAAEYLVDVVEIGDYIDIGIDYTNTQTFDKFGVVENYLETGMTGWRVLSKTGNGAGGTVTLVAAGTPLSFYAPYKPASSSIAMLEDLKKEITIVSSGTQGFTENGFTGGNDLKSIFESCNYIDQTKGVHALGCSLDTGNLGMKATKYSPLDEIESASDEVTGISDYVTDNLNQPLFNTSFMSGYFNLDIRNAEDLFGIGQNYWLGGCSVIESAGSWSSGAHTSSGGRRIVVFRE